MSEAIPVKCGKRPQELSARDKEILREVYRFGALVAGDVEGFNSWGFTAGKLYVRVREAMDLKVRGLLRIAESVGREKHGRIRVTDHKVTRLELTLVGESLGKVCLQLGDEMPSCYRVEPDGSVTYGHLVEYGFKQGFSYTINPIKTRVHLYKAVKVGDLLDVKHYKPDRIGVFHDENLLCTMTRKHPRLWEVVTAIAAKRRVVARVVGKGSPWHDDSLSLEVIINA